MESPRNTSWIAIGVLVVIAQLSAFIVIGYHARLGYLSATAPWQLRPQTQYAQIFHGRLVYPMHDLQSLHTSILRSVDLKSGQVIQDVRLRFPITGGLVTDGKRLWALGDSEVYETDGHVDLYKKDEVTPIKVERLLSDVESELTKRFQSMDVQALLPPEFEFGQERNAIPHRFRRGQIPLISDPATKEAFVLVASQTDEIDLYRLDGRQLVKLPIRIEGWGRPLLRWAGAVMLQLSAVLILGTVFVVLGADWWKSRNASSSYLFGNQTVELAPLRRRALARGIDLSVIFAPLIVQLGWIICNASADSIMFFIAVASIQPELVPRNMAPLIPTLLWAVLILSAFVLATGISGVTFGNWLCGVRVVRTTLRPCGFARSLVRELLFWLDTPLLLTAIPGVLCQLATGSRQRMGDLVAQTIVVDER